MMTILLITVSGLDRPGLVRELSDVVARVGANWEHSRMMHLAGRFVGLLEIRVDEGNAHELVKQLRELGDLELTIAEGQSIAPPDRALDLEMVGVDHPGIVSEVFGALAAKGINIESLTTGTEPAPDSGSQLFRAQARLSVPVGLDLATVRESLEALAEDTMVTIEIAEN